MRRSTSASVGSPGVSEASGITELMEEDEPILGGTKRLNRTVAEIQADVQRSAAEPEQPADPEPADPDEGEGKQQTTIYTSVEAEDVDRGHDLDIRPINLVVCPQVWMGDERKGMWEDLYKSNRRPTAEDWTWMILDYEETLEYFLTDSAYSGFLNRLRSEKKLMMPDKFKEPWKNLWGAVASMFGDKHPLLKAYRTKKAFQDVAKKQVVWDTVLCYQQAKKTRDFLLLENEAVNSTRYMRSDTMEELHRVMENSFEFYESYQHAAHQYNIPLNPVNRNDPVEYMNQLRCLRRFTWNRVKKTMENIGRCAENKRVFRRFGYARFASLAQRVMLGNAIFARAPPTVLATRDGQDDVLNYYTRYPGGDDDLSVRTVRALNATLWLCTIADIVSAGEFNPNEGAGIGPERQMVSLMVGSSPYVPDRERMKSLTRSTSREPSPARKQPARLMKKSLFTADGTRVVSRSRSGSPEVFVAGAEGDPDPPLPVLQLPPIAVAKPKPKPAAKSDGFGMAAIGIVALGIVLLAKGLA